MANHTDLPSIATSHVQAHAQAEALTLCLSESAQQLSQSAEMEAQLRRQLQAAALRLEESQEQCGQACSDCLSLRRQLADTASQLEQVRLCSAASTLCVEYVSKESLAEATPSRGLARGSTLGPDCAFAHAV